MTRASIYLFTILAKESKVNKAAGVFEIAARWTGESISPPRTQDTLAERIKRYVTVLDAISASLCYLNNTSNRPLYFNVLVKDPRRE
jgi:hypothetical protein